MQISYRSYEVSNSRMFSSRQLLLDYHLQIILKSLEHL